MLRSDGLQTVPLRRCPNNPYNMNSTLTPTETNRQREKGEGFPFLCRVPPKTFFSRTDIFKVRVDGFPLGRWRRPIPFPSLLVIFRVLESLTTLIAPPQNLRDRFRHNSPFFWHDPSQARYPSLFRLLPPLVFIAVPLISRVHQCLAFLIHCDF